MALAQFLSIPEYIKFYQERLQDGDTVILDNGAYEGVQMAAPLLHFWVKELKPSVVVLPDHPHDFVKTMRKSWDFLDRGLPKGVDGMLVLHAEEGKHSHFETAYGLCPVGWVGLSKLTKTYGRSHRWPSQRYEFIHYLKRTGQHRQGLHHHALGMLNGNVAELAHLCTAGFRSIDSSAPIWRGLLGYTMEDKWPGYEFQPVLGPEANNEEQAWRNLKQTLEGFHGYC